MYIKISIKYNINEIKSYKYYYGIRNVDYSVVDVYEQPLIINNIIIEQTFDVEKLPENIYIYVHDDMTSIYLCCTNMTGNFKSTEIFLNYDDAIRKLYSCEGTVDENYVSVFELNEINSSFNFVKRFYLTGYGKDIIVVCNKYYVRHPDDSKEDFIKRVRHFLTKKKFFLMT